MASQAQLSDPPNASLNALRAFDAAARHRSFTDAAGGLHVTQAAVSQEVRTLEDRLGAKLFVRGRKGLALTPHGEELRLHTSGEIVDLPGSGLVVAAPMPDALCLVAAPALAARIGNEAARLHDHLAVLRRDPDA